jgi:Topoisomerase 6 subunit A/Spo11, Toprim domain
MDSKAIISAVQGVTAKWTKQRKAEERHAAARTRRWDAMTYSRSISIKEAAYEVMPDSYLKASANDTLPAKARQVMYAARGKIQERTGKSLDDRYFTQGLLPDFMQDNPELTAGWKVVFDARGHLVEPHTGRSIPLGTLEVESYLRRLCDPLWSDPAASMPNIETVGPSGRYGALLFCEKEGFNDLFKAVQLAERYDLAIMSTKGVSVTAARRLVDDICARYQIPLFVLHDFDKSGFTILRTLQCDTRRYAFANKIEVIDLGLRLADVEQHGLESESVEYRESARSVCITLAEAGATEAEITFLLRDRVELNAFTSDGLVAWIEGKLEEHGVRKVIPDQEVLAAAYRRQRQSAYLKKHFGELLERSRQHIARLDVSPDLHGHVAQLLEEQPALSWDDAVAEIASSPT